MILKLTSLTHSLTPQPLDTQFILSICIGDLLLCAKGLFFVPLNIYYKGWWSGPIGCLFDGAFILYFLAISVFSMTGLALYRYV